MASSSRQSLRPSDQHAQYQNRQQKSANSTNNSKSLPAILGRKRKLENKQMVSVINTIMSFRECKNCLHVKATTPTCLEFNISV